jgi:hypothetical protein
VAHAALSVNRGRIPDAVFTLNHKIREKTQRHPKIDFLSIVAAPLYIHLPMISRKIEIYSWDVPFEKLPNDIRALLSENDEAAYKAGAQYFKDAASRTGEPDLINVLARLGDDHPMRVYLEKQDEEPWICWFGFTFVAEGRHVRFRPPSSAPLPPSIPARLRTIYENLGGINDDNSGDYGLLPPEKIIRASDSGHYFIPNILEESQKCWLFHSFGNGDYTGWSEDGEGAMLNHEVECLDSLDLDEFLNDYFRFDILGLEYP